MIAFLRGAVVSRDFDEVIIDVNGVGYGVFMSIRDVAEVNTGDVIEVVISEVVREQSFDLFGFIHAEDKKLFDQILKVNGVGPRIALALLGLGDYQSFANAVQSGNGSYLTSAPGVGKKLAERICVDMRDKVSAGTFISSPAAGTLGAREALIALGFKNDDIDRMTKNIDTSQPVEDQIKQALRER